MDKTTNQQILTNRLVKLGRGLSGAPKRQQPRWGWSAALAAYVSAVCVGGLAYRMRPADPAASVSLREILEPAELLVRVARLGLLGLAVFAGLGLLVCFFVNRSLFNDGAVRRSGSQAESASPRAARTSGLFRAFVVVLIAVGLSAFIFYLHLARPPSVAELLLPLCGVVLGGWVGGACLRGFRSVLWLIPKFVALVLLLGCGAGVALYFMTSDAPIAYTPPEVSPSDKAYLVERVQSSRRQGDDTSRLQFSEQDVDLLLAAGFEQLAIEGKADVGFDEDEVRLDFSLGVPFPRPLGRYLNCNGVYRTAVEKGKLRFRPVSLQMGRLRIPGVLLPLVGDCVGSLIRNNAQDVLASIDQLHAKPGAVIAVYHADALRQDLESEFQAVWGESPVIVAATREHLRELVTVAPTLPGGDEQFGAYLRTAFWFAQKRSEAGDPVVENKAAILALGIMLGHCRLESLVGPVADETIREDIDRYVGRVKLRGRTDWTRHFFVSAGLAVLSNETVSDAAGLLKEEIDSAEGGSGFSFSDLLADRAGTRLALVATGNPKAARRVQALLSRTVPIDAIFPPASDLPEGISEAELQDKYGGVGGPKYQEMIRVMEERLDRCAVFGGSR